MSGELGVAMGEPATRWLLMPHQRVACAVTGEQVDAEFVFVGLWVHFWELAWTMKTAQDVP